MRIWNPIDFQRSRSLGQIFRRGDMPRFALPLLYGAFYFQPSFLDVPNTILFIKNLTDFVWLVPFSVYKVVKMGPTHICHCKMDFYWQE